MQAARIKCRQAMPNRTLRTARWLGHGAGRLAAQHCLILAPPIWIWLLFDHLAPTWAVMWGMAVAMFFGCKTSVWTAADIPGVAVWRRTAFFVAYPGMDAARFLSAPTDRHDRVAKVQVARSVCCLLWGATLFWGIAYHVPNVEIQASLGMIGLVLMLHFGALNLINFAWMRAGVAVTPLMDSPWRAKNLAEFWGRRWNTAFRDLVTPLLFRPLARKHGVAAATWGTFLFSGIVHDLVISVPAGGGYGLPTLYFLLQALAIQWERCSTASWFELHPAATRRVFAWIVNIGPAGMLFHEPFREQVIIPFMKACGAL